MSYSPSKPMLRTAAVAVSVATLVAACGSSSSKSSPATTPSSGGFSSTAPAPTGTPIKIGVIGSETGAQASSTDQFATVAPAWADYVNKQLGGIKGHPVQVFVADDANDPATAQAAEKKLVDSDQVQAIVVGF